LKKLPVQTLKIDKLFIDNISTDKDAKSIVKTIIAMAKTLNKTTIVEGIETIEQLNILSDLDCDLAQGYYISKPKLAEDLLRQSNTEFVRIEDIRERLKQAS